MVLVVAAVQQATGAKAHRNWRIVKTVGGLAAVIVKVVVTMTAAAVQVSMG